MQKPPHTYYQHKLPNSHLMFPAAWFQWLFSYTLFHIFCSKLKKLSEDSLTKQPEEVFDVLEKLGEG